jgi:hypothetical protein
MASHMTATRHTHNIISHAGQTDEGLRGCGGTASAPSALIEQARGRGTPYVKLSPRRPHAHAAPLPLFLPLSPDPYDEQDYRQSHAKVRANPLLVKIQTGKVKATTYSLPPEGFVYGRRDQYQEEGVKEVVNSWQNHTPPAEAVPGRDFVKLNRSAVVRGAVSSKDIANFRTTHDARLKTGATITKGQAKQLDPSFTYGRPSKPSTPIHDVLNNTFQRNAIIAARRQAAFEAAQREQQENSKAGKFGQSQHTRASLGHMKIRAPDAREPFKLAKFKEVGPRIGSQGLSTGNAAPALQQQPAQQYYDDQQEVQQQSPQQQNGSSKRYEEEKEAAF